MRLGVLAVLVAPLLMAGLAHVGDLRGFAETIRSHGLVGGRAASPLARAVAFTEVAGVPVLLALVVARPTLMTAGAMAAATLFALFAGYLVLAHARVGRAREVECGCGGLGTRLHAWSWARPAFLSAALALIPALPDGDAAASGERLLAVAAGWSLATAGLCLWLLRRLNAEAMARARNDFRLLSAPLRSSGLPARGSTPRPPEGEAG